MVNQTTITYFVEKNENSFDYAICKKVVAAFLLTAEVAKTPNHHRNVHLVICRLELRQENRCDPRVHHFACLHFICFHNDYLFLISRRQVAQNPHTLQLDLRTYTFNSFDKHRHNPCG